MLLGYDFKDPVKWVRERMSSRKRYRQEIITTVVVGVGTLAVLVVAQLMMGLTAGSVMITSGICFLVIDAVVLRGIIYVMALRRLIQSDANRHTAQESENND